MWGSYENIPNAIFYLYKGDNWLKGKGLGAKDPEFRTKGCACWGVGLQSFDELSRYY